MKDSRLIALMQEVLDGEASPEETRELEAALAADPAARAQFAELQRLFAGLAAVPQAFPPEGLVAAVMARLPRQSTLESDRDQLFSPSGVIGATVTEKRGARTGQEA